jgi:hypothetical protein
MPPPLDPFQVLARRYGAATSTLATYRDRPLDWVNEFVEFSEGECLTPYQKDILAALADRKKVCMRSLHGAGKTALVALVVLWFAVTREATGTNWKCPTTAGSWRQLEIYLWPEIHKWANKLRWDAMDRAPFATGELLRNQLKLSFGSAFAVTSDDPARSEGAHADSILYVFDEAKTISDDTFDAAEGAFSGTGEVFALACSTPGEPRGRFYDIQTAKPGYADWYALHVTLDQAIKAGRVSSTWAAQRKEQWGEHSAAYANRVLGEFHADDAEGVIPLAWVERAVERWKAHTKDFGSMTRVGIDVARYGSDKTVIACCHGHRVDTLRYSAHEDTMSTVGRVGGILDAHQGAAAIVDADGLGAGVFDRLREQGHNVEPFHAGEKTRKMDHSNELGFVNARAAAWWQLREMLEDPDSDLELPDDPLLLGDLTSLRWKVTSTNQIQLESKVELKGRLGRSTDAADAVVMALWQDRPRRRARITGGWPT